MTFRLSRGFWWALGAGLTLAALNAAFLLLFEEHTVEVDHFDGPARSDAYYVLAHYLEERGLVVESEARWDAPPPEGTAVFWLNYEPLPHDVRQWLGQGGQLWSFTDPDGAFAWQPSSWLDTERPEAGPVEAVVVDTDACEDDACWEASQRERRLRACGTPEHDADTPCMMAAQFDYGAGCLTLVHANALVNAGLHDPQAAQRIDALLHCPEWPQRVWLVRDLQAPWVGQLLWERAPEALLAALVALVFFLWQRAFYMGAPAHPQPEGRRSWLEHLAAVGRLSARLGVAPLVGGARAELRRKLSTRFPELGNLEQSAAVEFLVARLKLPEQRVARALFATPAGDPAETLALTRDMLVLWRTL